MYLNVEDVRECRFCRCFGRRSVVGVEGFSSWNGRCLHRGLVLAGDGPGGAVGIEDRAFRVGNAVDGMDSNGNPFTATGLW